MGDRKHSRADFYEQGADFMESAASYAANRPPLSNALAGKKLSLKNVESDETIAYSFADSSATVSWSGAQEGSSDYEAFELSDGIFFVSFSMNDEQAQAMALDLNNGVATSYQGTLPEVDGENHRVKTTVLRSTIEELGGTEGKLHPASSLGGTRFNNIYNESDSPVEYEHIYLTKVYKTWLGIKGPQAGQADTEEYLVYKIADGIYFVSWTEKLLSTQMSFLFNFLEAIQVGQVFGLTDGTRIHQTIGAKMELIHSGLPELANAQTVAAFSE